jgi:hypothetical protein
MNQGPSLIELLDRLVNCPAEFSLTPLVQNPTDELPKGVLYLPALFFDLYFHFTGTFPNTTQTDFLKISSKKDNINILNIYSISIYTLFHPFFKDKKELGEKLILLFKKELIGYKGLILANKFLQDPERREELIRFLLFHLGFAPNGETEKYAIGRLSTLDSIERVKLIDAARQAQIKREAEIKEAIRKREAEEAASRMTGE